MQHLSAIYLAIIFIGAVALPNEAKRGCALYGHSCYGGHGKRSDVPRVEFVPLENNQMALNKPFQHNKEIIYPSTNDMNNDNPMNVNNDWRWNTKNDFGYAIYNIIRQWMDDARKSANADAPQTTESDTVFKNNFV